MQSRTTVVAAVVVVIAGIALVPIREFASEPNDAEGALSSVAFAAPFIAAGLIALLGVHRAKPIYSVAAGVALLPISLVSFILIPLLVPAMLLIAIGMTVATQSSNRDVGISIVVTVGLVAAFAALLVHQDPATWSTLDSSGMSSDIVTTREATLGLSIVASVLLIAALFGRSPSPHPRAPAPPEHMGGSS